MSDVIWRPNRVASTSTVVIVT
ncbi:MAG: hypothetical protein JWN61_2422, partial [Pseudonocardiales bacterium]|nr:hypothetical protein [Pseudonocardiales bacterium]